MRILVLKSNINTPDDQVLLQPAFDAHPAIYRWSVDTEDCDKVLRIEAADELSYEQVIAIAGERDFYCEELTY
ncbi:MAG: hypothetical protein AAGA85_15555 [Bacteroidota bacterium]